MKVNYYFNLLTLDGKYISSGELTGKNIGNFTVVGKDKNDNALLMEYDADNVPIISKLEIKLDN